MVHLLHSSQPALSAVPKLTESTMSVPFEACAELIEPWSVAAQALSWPCLGFKEHTVKPHQGPVSQGTVH